MRPLLLATVLMAGCAEVAEDPKPPETVPGPARPDEPETQLTSSEGARCELLPTDGSACAHACDPDALKAFIPPGTCATFECPLSDGTTFRAGGCNQ